MANKLTLVAESAYLDPDNCNSKISYKVAKRRNYRRGKLYGSVILSDCTHEIEWYFYDTLDPLTKVDKAIAMLNSFREDYIAAQKKIKAKRSRAAKRAK